ncbi:MAG: tRNA preQ1(34) S-adenosylmethionine ribosyltransferase-isomerase QueA [Thermoleophilia bacterium]|nr:tRNA preQ1(34) S-adenosylmethionine ribosyltransferase-isomerase QueA [Thermoleophilia bacterium]
MRISELDYELPEELIAQAPVEPRDASRLLIVRRATKTLEDAVFSDLPSLLCADDLVVLNSTRVRAARLSVTRATGGAAEVLLLEPKGEVWQALVRPARKLKPGARLAGNGLEVEIVEVGEAGEAIVRLHAEGSIDAAIEQAGVMPLPPYIRASVDDAERYQTVYSRTIGSAAAPTAGLHFTPALLERVRATCEVVEVDLHVGLDTFRPVTVDSLEQHEMHSEFYSVDPAVRSAISTAVAEGRRVVAIGTTTTRVLETIADPTMPNSGRTSILLQPGVSFRTVGALVTNFHLPRSTLLALVMGLAGESLIRDAYAHAVNTRYRFYSFGDAMVIL